MTAQPVSLSELNRAVIRSLCKEFGVVNTIRFLNQYSTGSGDYTRERAATFDPMTVDEIADEIVKNRTLQEQPA